MPSHCISAVAPLRPPEAFRRIGGTDSSLLVDPAFEPAIRGLDFMAHPGEPAHGRGPSVILDLPGRPERLHVRALRHGGWLGGFWGTRIAGLGRPTRELEATRQLRARGAPVPHPVMVWGRRHGMLWEALLGTVCEEETRDGITLLASRPDSATIIEAARSAGSAVRKLHDAGCRHADLHIGNLLLRSGDHSSEVIVVDLDEARVGSAPGTGRRMRELMRLYRSLVKRGLLESVERSGCNTFLDAYVDGDGNLRQELMRYWRREKLRIKLHSLTW